MYSQGDKRRLNQLIKMYLSNKITTTVFCDEVYYCFDLELESSELTDEEKRYFRKLDNVTSRYSEFEEDFKLAPRAFNTDKDVYEKAKETRCNLSSLFSALEEEEQLDEE